MSSEKVQWKGAGLDGNLKNIGRAEIQSNSDYTIKKLKYEEGYQISLIGTRL